MHVDHLHGFELFENGAGCQSRRFGFDALFQGDLQAVAQERYEEVLSISEPFVVPVTFRSEFMELPLVGEFDLTVSKEAKVSVVD